MTPEPTPASRAPTDEGVAPPPPSRSRDERREQLLQVGERLFATRAYDEVSIDEIAQAAGMSRGLLYHYFPSKQAFHLAVVERILAELRRRLTPDPALPPVRALADVLHRFFAYVGEHDVGARALARGEAGTGTRLQALLEGFREDTVEQVLGALARRGLATRPSPDLRVALRGWASAVEGLALGWLAHGDPRSTAERDRLVGLASTLLADCLEHGGVRPERALAAGDDEAGGPPAGD